MALVLPTAESNPPWPGQAALDSTDLGAVAAGCGETGVLSGCFVTALGTVGVPNYAASVSSGSVVLSGSVIPVSAAASVRPAASGTTDRRDAVVFNTSTGSVQVLTGASCQMANWVPNPTYLPPVKPYVPIGSILLGEIYVYATSTNVTPTEVTDKTLIITLSSNVKATDASIVVSGTAPNATLATGTLDVVASVHPAAATVGMNHQRIASVAAGSVIGQAAIVDQVPGFQSFVGANASPTVPVTGVYMVVCVGQGGGGGSGAYGAAYAALQPGSGGGGAGGVVASVVALSSASTYVVTAASVANAAGTNTSGSGVTGTAGNPTSFGTSGGALLTAQGGGGGVGSAASAGSTSTAGGAWGGGAAPINNATALQGNGGNYYGAGTAGFTGGAPVQWAGGGGGAGSSTTGGNNGQGGGAGTAVAGGAGSTPSAGSPAGGDASAVGAGGGGGGAGDSQSFHSGGRGGNGGPGAVYIIGPFGGLT